MLSAIEDRNNTRDSLKSFIIPANVSLAVEIYQQHRNDPTWRSTRYIEALGEAASQYVEALDSYNNLPTDCKSCKFFGRNKKGHSHRCHSIPIDDGSCYRHDDKNIQLYNEMSQ